MSQGGGWEKYPQVLHKINKTLLRLASLHKNEIVQPRAQYAVVNASNVNIRSNAGTSYKVVGQLPKGVTVITTYTKQKYANGMWWQEIQSKYGNGWVADKYLNHIG